MEKMPVIQANSVNVWKVDTEVDGPGGLASDFDGSFSGLGVELGTASYNMSDALLALPVFASKNLETQFQYVLGAATSPATKMNEETLTYLNQGQSYEIKLKKLGDLSDFQGKLLKSHARVGFHERRLQYMEAEQVKNWREAHPKMRMLNIDVPLSYGIMEVKQANNNLCQAEFIWDPTKEAGVYIQVHCISTEFTAKKHGGEKGVPFRIQVDTFTCPTGEEESSMHLHSASCQVKVFKPKGADRKHKTDRDKMEKRPPNEQEKYQPSYDCTVLTECSYVYEPSFGTPLTCNHTPSRSPASTPSPAGMIHKQQSALPQSPNNPAWNSPHVHHDMGPRRGSSSSLDSIKAFTTSSNVALMGQPLYPSSTADSVSHWLEANRFAGYIKVFSSFSGTDLLRLGREDLIEICGLVDGIRLFNALHARHIRPRMTLYMCQAADQVYHAIYLEQLTLKELVQKVAEVFGINPLCISDMHWKGPNGIPVLLTDEVIHNFKDQSRFSLDLAKVTDELCKVIFIPLE